jgi:fumarate hydratase class I
VRVCQRVKTIADFIRATSSSIPDDVETALKKALRKEEKGSSAKVVLETILSNIKLAREKGTPLCQDTGTLTFFVSDSLKKKITVGKINEAVAYATQQGWLRRNTIDSLTGKSIDTNVCEGSPVVHYIDEPFKRVRLIMKGGGSENMSVQFSLPDADINAGRDFEGIRKAVLTAVQKAQGFGCAPGYLGVAVGGDRACGFDEAKEQLLRAIDDVNPVAELAKLEKRILKEANSLGIGPMGLGGKTTLLGVKIGVRPRLPASYFVTVAYMCWAARRRTMEVK